LYFIETINALQILWASTHLTKYHVQLHNFSNWISHSYIQDIASADLLPQYCQIQGADFAAIKRLGGWKSTSIAESYIEDSIQNKVNIAKQLFCTNETASSSKAPGDINCNEVT
jgi:hypothetical protein